MARGEEAAEEAYRAYAASLGYRGPDGMPMASWYGLRREEQEAWEAVADRLMEEVVLIREMSEESLN